MGKKASKRYIQCLDKVPEGRVSVEKAAEIVRGFTATKFDPTV